MDKVVIKEVRSTIYLEEDLYKRFREACNKKFGDKQGKIKQGYVLAITNFANEVLEDVVDIVIEMKPQAKKLEEAVVETPQEVIVSAKKLEEAEIKTPQQVIEESKIIETKQVVAPETPQAVVETPQEVAEIPTSVADTPPISATKQDQAKIVSVDEGLLALANSIPDKEATASVQLDQVKAKAEPTNKEVDKPEEVLEEERLAKVREDQRQSKLQTQSQNVGENSIEAKAKRLADRRRKAEREQLEQS